MEPFLQCLDCADKCTSVCRKDWDATEGQRLRDEARGERAERIRDDLDRWDARHGQ